MGCSEKKKIIANDSQSDSGTLHDCNSPFLHVHTMFESSLLIKDLIQVIE